MKMPEESKRKRFERRLGHMKSERSSFDAHWRELAEHFMPRRGRFTLGERNKGDKRHQKIIDGTTIFAARTLSSGMMAGLTSPARPWFRLTTPDPDLAERTPVKLWLHAVELRMRELFDKSNLYEALPQVYGELGVFGTSAMVEMEDDRDVIRFYPQTVGAYWLANSSRMDVDTLYREQEWTVRQVVQEFGIDAASNRTRMAFQQGNLETTVWIAHLIEPNDERLIHRMDAAGMEYRSCYWEIGSEEDKLLAERGFREKPFMAPRWSTLGEDTYGSSPGMDALGDAKALQFQQKRKAQAIDKMIDPPLMGPTSLRNNRVSLLPGDVTYIDTNQNGQGLKSIYDVQLNPQMLLEDTQALQGRIDTAFYADLFLMLSMSDRRQITAREIEERHEEKLLMLGPVLERLNGELLDPIIDRTFNIMLRRGLVPEPPDEIQGVDLRVEYISILAQAQKAVGLGAVDRLTGFVGNAAAVNPGILDKLDWDQAVDEYGIMLGVPPRLVRSDEDVAKIRQDRAQQERAQQMGQMAQPMAQAAKAAKDMSEIPMGGDNALAAIMGGLQGGQG